MTAVLIVIGLLLVTGFVLWLLDIDIFGGQSQSSLGQVRDELFVADQRVDCEFRQARRAMNDAAGQSWRNLAE